MIVPQRNWGLLSPKFHWGLDDNSNFNNINVNENNSDNVEIISNNADLTKNNSGNYNRKPKKI